MKEWDKKYVKILDKFGYSRKKDEEAALLLDSIIKSNTEIKKIKKLVAKKPVIVIGAGPSITKSLAFLKKNKKITKIAADGATQFLLENSIIPNIVVTDLDGDEKSLLDTSKKSIMVVHAHGDNMQNLHLVENFSHCIGTTQSTPIGKIFNFGGFTDGDRAVCLAHYFDAKKIILLGMDFGTRIGRYSKTKRKDRKIKLKKLNEGKSILTWIAKKNSKIFSTSNIKGTNKINIVQLDDIIIT